MELRRPTVIVLASGRGERFLASGGTAHKLSALLGGRPVLEHTLAAVRDSGLPWHLEDAGHPGMGDSIAAAVRATADAAGWLILPADLPLVQPATLRRIAEALSPSSPQASLQWQAVQPVHAGARGHPVGFAASNGAALMALAGPLGAASVLRGLRATNAVGEVEVDDPGVVTDIDTLADLARAEALLLSRRA
jgi:molybdenum cofactor cytidylyltransferase